MKPDEQFLNIGKIIYEIWGKSLNKICTQCLIIKQKICSYSMYNIAESKMINLSYLFSYSYFIWKSEPVLIESLLVAHKKKESKNH